jgi:hypothetical protein
VHQQEHTTRVCQLQQSKPNCNAELHIVNKLIDAKQGRDTKTHNILTAFVQTDVDKKAKGKHIIMKIKGALVKMLVKISPEVYKNYMMLQGKVETLYVIMF